jgi:benzoyl-CoA reductase/2-hydroxyglutaryl-CoA dehydratase subunit BcrC/BadD/HgdB
LRELVVIKDEVRDEKLNELENKTKEELKQQIDEVKQQINEVKQQNQQMRILLNGIIKGLNIDINNEIEETENVDAIKEE